METPTPSQTCSLGISQLQSHRDPLLLSPSHEEPLDLFNLVHLFKLVNMQPISIGKQTIVLFFCLCTGVDPGFCQKGTSFLGQKLLKQSYVQSELSVTVVQGTLKDLGSFWNFNAQYMYASSTFQGLFSLISDI